MLGIERKTHSYLAFFQALKQLNHDDIIHTITTWLRGIDDDDDDDDDDYDDAHSETIHIESSN